MTALEEWKNDFKGYINELSLPKDDYMGIREYIDEVPNETRWIPITKRPMNIVTADSTMIGYASVIVSLAYLAVRAPKKSFITKNCLKFESAM